MPECPLCAAAETWRLGDGRYKCRSCRKRYTHASIWSSFRIPNRKKTLLVERFVFGTPVRRQRYRPAASAPTAERFYRAIRAFCLLSTAARMRHQQITDNLGIALTEDGAFLTAEQPIDFDTRPDGTDDGARKCVYTAADVQVVPQIADDPKVGAFLAFFNYWTDVWLQRRSRPSKLMLAEICWRFNHRGEDIFTLLIKGLKTTPSVRTAAILRERGA